MVGVLFRIQCDIQQLGKSVIYADVDSFSDYPEEKEVLFDLNASFRLDAIEQDGSIQVIHMTVTKRWREDHQRLHCTDTGESRTTKCNDCVWATDVRHGSV